jgi:hypothetical protein
MGCVSLIGGIKNESKNLFGNPEGNILLARERRGFEANILSPTADQRVDRVNCCWPTPAQSFSSRSMIKIFILFHTSARFEMGPPHRRTRTSVQQHRFRLFCDRRSVSQSVLVSSPHL